MVSKSIALIQEMEPMALRMDSRGYCVCSSFGKDSVALVELFIQAGVKFFVQHNITGIDPPPLVYFARQEIERLENMGIGVFVVKPRISMFDLIVHKGMPPTRLIRYCCKEFKERRIPENRDCFHSFGVRKSESATRNSREALEVVHNRRMHLGRRFDLDMSEQEAQLVFSEETIKGEVMLFDENSEKRKQFESCTIKGIRAINPMIAWTDDLLWDFIKSNSVPYCELYDQGYSRLGCVGCPNNSQRKHEMKVFNFERYYLNAFEKMLRVWQDKGQPRDWKTAQEVMDWWLEK